MSLDIHQMQYFINIVECGFNLSLAARRVGVSQPALSQFISQFETNEEVTIFQRRKGRLVGLTDSGQRIYTKVQEVLQSYDELEAVIAQEYLKRPGVVRVGLPSLILRTYFSELFPRLTIEYPGLQIEIIEAGSKQLRKKILKDDLDIAILTEPTALNDSDFQQELLYQGEIYAYMSTQHPLAKVDQPLQWQQLLNYPLASFIDSFNTNQQVQAKISEINAKAKLNFTATTWDYLLDITSTHEIISLLPSLISQILDDPEDFSIQKTEEPLPFKIRICRRALESYEPTKALVYDEIFQLFQE